jgi:hypothetical protein
MGGLGGEAFAPCRPFRRADSRAMNFFAPVTVHPALACAALLTVSNLLMTFIFRT